MIKCLRVKHFLSKPLTLLLVLLFSIPVQGQQNIENPQKANVDFEISEVIQNQLTSVLKKEKKIPSIVPLLETLCQKNPLLAEFLVDTISDKLVNKPYSKGWAELQYFKTWLSVENYSENEELELLHTDALECQEFFEHKGEDYWLSKTYGLLAGINYNISYNNEDSLYTDASKYLNSAFDLLSVRQNVNQNTYSLLGELFRIKGSICFNKNNCNIDSTLAFYETGLEYYKIDNNLSGQVDIYINKAIALTEKEKNASGAETEEKAIDFYRKAIEIAQQDNDLAKNRLEFATYLGDKYLATGEKEWNDQSNEQLQLIIAKKGGKKCEAYFQLAMNAQTFLSLSTSDLTEVEQKNLMDSLFYYYEQTLIKAKGENNLKAYNEIFNRLSFMCPYFPKDKCSHLLQIANEVKTYFLQKNKEINEKNTRENKAFQKALEAQKRQYVWQQFFIALLMILVIFLILFQRQKVKNLNLTIAIKQEALRAQMNPHFISNSINAIESLVNQERNEEASEYLIDFSRLCRLIIDYSKCPKITLQNEISTLKYFLSLEKLRLADDLDYTISIDNQLLPNHIMIPPLILQPFVENAIWHGIKNKPEPKKGELKIEVNKLSDATIECIIEDNGVGRARAMEIQKESVIDQKSWGMALTQQRIDHLKQYNHAKLEIIDLYNQKDEPRGTKVKLQLPILSKKDI